MDTKNNRIEVSKLQQWCEMEASYRDRILNEHGKAFVQLFVDTLTPDAKISDEMAALVLAAAITHSSVMGMLLSLQQNGNESDE